MIRFRRASLTLAALVALGGCSDIANMISPAGTADARPARVAFTASVAAATVQRADVVTLKVTSLYVQAGGVRVPIGSQVITLGAAVTQDVPVPVDLVSCLADPARDGASVDAGCSVVLQLALVVNGVTVDNQTVGPLRLAAGATTAVTQPVELFELASIDVTPSAGVSVTMGSTTALAAVVKDSKGRAVTNRPVTWSSNAPTVATIDANGVVTAIGVGQALMSASAGGLSADVLVNVLRAPVSLVVGPLTGSGSGTVQSLPAGINCRVTAASATGACAFNFPADAQVVLTSTPDAGQIFGAWGGACLGSAVGTTCSLTMSQARTTSAQFIAQRRLTVNASTTDGRGRITGPFGLDCRIDGTTTSGSCVADVADGTSLTLTSIADSATAQQVAQSFGQWGGACATASGSVCTVVVTANTTVNAGFLGGRPLTVSVTGAGGGTVTATNGVACTASNGAGTGTCAASAMFGSTVTLTAQANAQSTFAGWSGACAGQSTACTVVMSQAQTVTASFARRQVQLTVIISGTGDAALAVNGAPLCARNSLQTGTATCVTNLDVGATASITSTMSGQTDFLGYAGDCIGTGACAVMMTAPRTVTAHFAGKVPVTLTIDALALGSGVVRSTEASPLIDCPITAGVASGPKCSVSVAPGTSITLRAIGNTGNALTYWGDGCANRTTYECTVVVNSAVRASAGFTPAIDVDMRLAGSGQGSITFQPAAAPSQQPCVMSGLGAATNCRFSLPIGSTGVFRGLAATGTYVGITGPCVESVGSTPVPVCTYRGIGFVRVFNASFTFP